MASRETPVQHDDIERSKWIVVGTRNDNGQAVEMVVLSRSEKRAREIVEKKRISVKSVSRLTADQGELTRSVPAPGAAPEVVHQIESDLPSQEPGPSDEVEQETPRRAMCVLCSSTWLERRDVPRMSKPVQLIGAILLTPSVLGMAAAVIGIVWLYVDPKRVRDEPADVLLARVVLFVGLFVASFVSGLLGWLLIMNRRVLVCLQCGAAYDAV